MTTVTSSKSLNEITTPEALVKEHPELFTCSQMNWLLKTREVNGLSQSGAVLKVSRKLYVNRGAFINWFMEQKAS